MRQVVILAAACLAVGCATVRQVDLDAWVGMPVEALDTHTFFITVPMERRITDSGVEIRNYRNGGGGASCISNTFATGTGKNAGSFTTTNCDDGPVCNNIFFIKNGKVLEYAPKGRCMTNAIVQPEARYRRLSG